MYGSQGAILAEGTIGQGTGGTLEGVFGLGDAPYDAAQSKDVSRRFRRIPFREVNPYTAECEYFANCILRGRRPAINDATNALRMAALTAKAYASGPRNRILTA